MHRNALLRWPITSPSLTCKPRVSSTTLLPLTHSLTRRIQFAAAAGLANCPGAPRLEFLAGRPFTSRPSPPNLVPGPNHSVDRILSRMADSGFSAIETVDLLASHSIAAQEGQNPSIAVSLKSTALRGVPFRRFDYTTGLTSRLYSG